jgi:DedD protein
MAKDQSDDELNLRRKARRRLIGAAALTLAVVVILPMVLDSEPKPSGKDIDLRIPSPDKVGEFVPGTAVSEVAATLSPAAANVVTTPIPLAAPVIATPVQEVTPSKAPVHQPSETAKPVEPPKPAEAKSSDKPANTESYVAQVGAYSNQRTAKQELRKLKKWGFKAYTEKAGDKIRVRIGPYADREKAEKVSHLLEKHGLHPVVMSVQ